MAAAVTALACAAPADARLRVRPYEIEAAKGKVRVNFHGDEAAGCRELGVCGVSGTVTYAFGGKPRFGEILWARNDKRTISFYGFLETTAATAADVTTAGSSERCVDHREDEEGYETLQFEPRSQRVRFNWRQVVEDEEEEGLYIGGPSEMFDTRCAGPELLDLAQSGALPSADIPYRVFRSPRSSFVTTGSRPFAGGGFAGTVDWGLRYHLRYRQGGRGQGFFAFR